MTFGFQDTLPERRELIAGNVCVQRVWLSRRMPARAGLVTGSAPNSPSVPGRIAVAHIERCTHHQRATHTHPTCQRVA